MSPSLQSNELSQRINAAAEALLEHFGTLPSTLIVAGSGLGGFAATLKDATSLGYGDIPHFPVSTVVGHAGKLVKGKCEGHEVLVMNGRKHLYEGVDSTEATLPLRALLKAGIKTVILSNAAGALNVRFDVGDLMLITDQINNMYRNPLMGGNLDDLGPRFPDMSEPYSRELATIAREVAVEKGIPLREGVYIANMGPTYETQAEVQMLRQFGDVVGMSTAPETLVAIHAGARVLGITLVSNSLVRRTDVVTTHDEVMEAGKEAAGKFNELVGGVVRRLHQ
ncbi:MAG: purine-nucleoside phosphorylase [Candidatus Sumerlaeia bacterium]|nr:purine-nucleoside phosphorylase [Candidatus Sumerlaeia bacterium]